MKLAVLIGNRGFFPSSVIEGAREELRAAMEKQNLEPLFIGADAVKYGAVETTAEGEVYRAFLEAHRGEYDGLIISLPNFGDENGIKAAIRDLDLPILLQAYPDEIGQMDFAHRRDAFCGKLGLTSVFKQMGVKYTAFAPFVVHPSSAAFQTQLTKFAAICRVVKKMKHLRVGAIGARTTAFKSVRYDEIALEKHGIDLETLDLYYVMDRFEKMGNDDPAAIRWHDKLVASMRSFGNMPEGRDWLLARLGAVIEQIIGEMSLDAVAVRCWNELPQIMGIAPCALLGLLNGEGVPAACELDVTNALAMTALNQASTCAAGLLDWNNNYGDDPEKCILFHCGPLAVELMTGPGEMQQHLMFKKTFGEDSGWGLNVDKIAPGRITFCSMRNEDGQVQYYAGSGDITDDAIEKEYFGTPGVLKVEDLQTVMGNISANGFRHHVAITRGDWVEALDEALGKYLGYVKVDVKKK